MGQTTKRNTKLNPYVSVDCVIFGFDQNQLKVLLIDRRGPDEKNGDSQLALPGNLIFQDEDLDDAARRVLKELTNLDQIYLRQFKTFGDPHRLDKEKDRKWLNQIREIPEARVITVAYYSLVRSEKYLAAAAGFARSTKWINADEIPELAFDHNLIVSEALNQLRQHIYRNPIVFELLPTLFTLSELQSIYELILRTNLDKRNFRRKILGTGYVVPSDKKQTGVPYKPPLLYSFNKDKFDTSNDRFVSF